MTGRHVDTTSQDENAREPLAVYSTVTRCSTASTNFGTPLVSFLPFHFFLFFFFCFFFY